MADSLHTEEARVRLNLLYSAADKVSFDKRFSLKPEGVYTPFNVLADRVSAILTSVDGDGTDECKAVLSMAQARNMTVAEFVTLAAGVSSKFMDQSQVNNPFNGLGSSQLKVIDSLLGKGIAYSPDLADKIIGSSKSLDMTIADYLMGYGRMQISGISEVYEGGLPELRKNLLQDMESGNTPTISKLTRESEARISKFTEESERRIKEIKAEAGAHSKPGPQNTEAEVKHATATYFETQRLASVVQLAKTTGVDFNLLPESERRRLLDMDDSSQLYAELSRLGLTTDDRGKIRELEDLEKEKNAKLAALDREREEFAEETAKKREGFAQRAVDDEARIERMRKQGLNDLKDQLGRDFDNLNRDHQSRSELILMDGGIDRDMAGIYVKVENGELDRKQELMLRAALQYMDETFHLTFSDALRVSGAKNIAQSLVRDRPDLFPTQVKALDFVVNDHLSKKSLAGDGITTRDIRRIATRREILQNTANNIEEVLKKWAKAKGL